MRGAATFRQPFDLLVVTAGAPVGAEGAMRPIRGSDGPRALLFGGWWLAVVLLVLGGRARRVGPALRAI